MPTDLVALLARKKRAQALALDNSKLMLVWLAATGLIIEMLFISHSFEQAVLLIGGGG